MWWQQRDEYSECQHWFDGWHDADSSRRESIRLSRRHDRDQGCGDHRTCRDDR